MHNGPLWYGNDSQDIKTHHRTEFHGRILLSVQLYENDWSTAIIYFITAWIITFKYLIIIITNSKLQIINIPLFKKVFKKVKILIWWENTT